ncbi:MAG: VOC family protein [Gammaproteobacteria bacterium]|nr:VOC family protein [Gammaproteobacteria bacterium]MCP5406289.1 VOC family protein [Chromatiaceae bacterium]MCP5407957.1 VOC family protein [Chromatiaceae bacterium]MCP5442852.1 VOC family protein [Chromatiaceae bacterium]
MPVKSIPEHYHSVTPYLSIKGANEAIEFYKRAFDAVEQFRMPTPGGEIGHAELQIGDSRIMMSDPCGESPIPSPDTLGGSSIGLHLYVEDVDKIFAQAVNAGATELKPVENQFYGDRMGTLKDPFGHIWFLSTHVEDLTPEEIGRRAEALFNPDNG